MKSGPLTAFFNRFSARLFWGVFAVIAICLAVISFVQTGSQSDDTRAKRISQQLRCIECEGLSVAESETPTSKTIVRDVQRRVEDGQSDAEIFNYYESVYGEFIRLAPTTNSGNWLIYVVPVFLVIILIASIVLSIRKDTNKKVVYGFWIATSVLALVGVGLFINDSRNPSSIVAADAEISTRDLLEQEVRDNPTASNLKNLAIIQFAQEEYVEALKNFDEAFRLDPQDAESRAYSAYIVLQAQQYEQALTRAEEAVAIDDENVPARFFRGVVLYTTPSDDPAVETANNARANEDFDAVLELAPDSTFAEQITDLRASQ
jgi:cytochrome c-type biogenesis protein CcmH